MLSVFVVIFQLNNQRTEQSLPVNETTLNILKTYRIHIRLKQYCLYHSHIDASWLALIKFLPGFAIVENSLDLVNSRPIIFP